jgi:tetratricopeptide (TPR) repeat protein
MLEDYCLVTTDNTRHTFEMHGLVQLSMRRWLNDRGLEERFTHKYIRLMADAFPRPYYDKLAECQRLICHVEATIHHRLVGSDIEQTRAMLLFNGGQFAFVEGNFGTAELMLRKSRNARAEILGEGAMLTVLTTSLYAHVLIDMGRLREAEHLLVRTLEHFKLKIGPNNHHMLRITALLANVYSQQDRSEESAELNAQVLATLKITVGANHLDTWGTMSHLQIVHLEQSKLEEAKSLYLEVLEGVKTRCGDDDPVTLAIMGNLAIVLCKQGLFEAAKNLFLQVVEAYKRLFGVSHPVTLRSMCCLAETLRAQGLLEDARKLGVEVLEIRTSRLGPDHMDTLDAGVRFATTLCVQGSVQNRHTEGLVLLRKYTEAGERVLGPRHPTTLLALRALQKWGS